WERIPFGPALDVSGGRSSARALWALTLADAAAGAVLTFAISHAELSGQTALGTYEVWRAPLFAIGGLVALLLLDRHASRAAMARAAALVSGAALLAIALSTSQVAVVAAAMTVAATSGVS